MSDRFYFAGPLGIGEVILDGPEAHHLAQVRRFQVGDRVVLFPNDGAEYPAEILAISRKQVHLSILTRETPQRELGFPLHIACAMPKGDRGDFLIEKLTELGVTDFTPLRTARGIVEVRDTKIEKLERAVIEASKQCGRNVLVRIHPSMDVVSWMARTDLPTIRWIAHPGGSTVKFPEQVGTGFAVMIGPEGGFTEDEVNRAHGSGFAAFSFGSRILRVETAAITVAAWIGLNGG